MSRAAARAWHCDGCSAVRGVLPSPDGRWAVLVCARCDFDRAKATSMPREAEIREPRPGDERLVTLP